MGLTDLELYGKVIWEGCVLDILVSSKLGWTGSQRKVHLPLSWGFEIWLPLSWELTVERV